MQAFIATESKDCVPTGVVETYLAASVEQAVESLLYTRRLSDGKAFIGPTGRAVYSMGALYVVTPAA